MGKKFISVDDAIDNLWTATDEMYFWHKDTITYSLITSGWADNGVDHAATISAKAQAEKAFELWDDVIGLKMNATQNDADANIVMYYTNKLPAGGLTTTPSTGSTLLDATIQIASGTPSAPSDLGYSSVTFSGLFLHEIGHSLGLDHPSNYDMSDKKYPTYEAKATFAQDTVQYTVMSYFGGWTKDADGTWSFKIHGEDDPGALYPQTPMLYDIAAVQKVYGHDWDTRGGDTTYGFHSNAGKDLYDFNKNPNPIMTIWDGKGNDTLDASGFSQDQRIDLREGHFSTIGALHDNIAIAYDCVIENATGGSGNDNLYGNGAANVLRGGNGNDNLYGDDNGDFLFGEAGQDKLYGGLGQDYLGGGMDNDTFMYLSLAESKVGAPDIIIDFRTGDRINLLAIDANETIAGNQAFKFVQNFTGHAGELQWDKSASDIFAVTADVNGDKVADFALQVYHLATLTQLTASDFIL